MINIWNPYQCMVTFNMSRSASYFESGLGRGMGFRDSAQDLLGFVHLIPKRARERILDVAATQLPDGSAYHQYQPLTKRGNDSVGTGFNDDPLWLIEGTAAYVRETGDLAILDEPVPFDNNPDNSCDTVRAPLPILPARARSSGASWPPADRASGLERLPQSELRSQQNRESHSRRWRPRTAERPNRCSSPGCSSTQASSTLIWPQLTASADVAEAAREHTAEMSRDGPGARLGR